MYTRGFVVMEEFKIVELEGVLREIRGAGAKFGEGTFEVNTDLLNEDVQGDAYQLIDANLETLMRCASEARRWMCKADHCVTKFNIGVDKLPIGPLIGLKTTLGDNVVLVLDDRYESEPDNVYGAEYKDISGFDLVDGVGVLKLPEDRLPEGLSGVLDGTKSSHAYIVQLDKGKSGLPTALYLLQMLYFVLCGKLLEDKDVARSALLTGFSVFPGGS
jgi:hypothetical protein